MADNVLLFPIISFCFFTALVGLITCLIVRSRRKHNGKPTVEKHLVGGKSFPWYFITGSLMLTNLSSEQLVGQNGSSFKDACMASIGLDNGASIAMCVASYVFLPTYLASGCSTTSAVLEARFGSKMRSVVSSLFLMQTVLVYCPCVLYSGAAAFRQVFQLDIEMMWITTTIGVIGACYSVFGGLEAVVVSDCINGIGFLIVGIWVLVAGISMIGGWWELFKRPDYMRTLVNETNQWDEKTSTRSPAIAETPWHVYFTGLPLNSLFYWGINQVIMQRAIAAKSRAEGQKGLLCAALLKLAVFFFTIMPGVIMAIIVDERIPIGKAGTPVMIRNVDEAYPTLVRSIVPDWALGFFAAVHLGGALSSFNSALNTAATLFTLEIFKVHVNPRASEQRTKKIAFGVELVVALASFITAPWIGYAGNIFNVMQRGLTMIAIPMTLVFLIYFTSSQPDTFAVSVGMVTSTIVYSFLGVGAYINDDEPLHYLHDYAIGFAAGLLATFALTIPGLRRGLLKTFPLKVPSELIYTQAVSEYHWPYQRPVIAAIVFLFGFSMVACQRVAFTMFLAFVIIWSVALLTFFLMGTEDGEDMGDSSALSPNTGEMGMKLEMNEKRVNAVYTD